MASTRRPEGTLVDLLDRVLDRGLEAAADEEHDVGGHRFELLDDRFDRALRVAPLLAERIEAEGAELARKG